MNKVLGPDQQRIKKEIKEFDLLPLIEALEKIGFDRSETIKYMNSFSVRQKVKRAIELSKQFKVTATPMIFVDGQYRIEAKGGHAKMLKVVDHVIKIQKPVS